MEGIIAALVTGGLSLLGVIITIHHSNTKIQARMELAQAVTDTKITELTREVREHNSFARRLPVLEEKMESANRRLQALEAKKEEEGRR